ncbi:hypothetical protein [Streptomyces sp. Da 82-17]|uniref:hypothetical protein n=1 Tax=Streptomyces sp. Da 82-17 TaxID=3377116 RepID=UPI0038D3A2B7
MSGDQHYYFGGGDHVTMNQGSGNVGIDKRVMAAPELQPELREALDELRALIEELRPGVDEPTARDLDENLPALRTDTAVQPQERRRALLAAAGIAATVSALGVPVVEAVNKCLELLAGS